MRKKTKSDRRTFLKASAATLVAATVPVVVAGQKDEKGEADARSQPVYLYGCGWNRNLPGVFGQACFSFDIRADLGGTGVGTIRDDVHPEVNSQFEITSAEKQRQEYIFSGAIISSQSPDLVGKRITVTAESLGNGMGRASLIVETQTELVVIAIIGILIGLLLPHCSATGTC
jgi:hypothetical protein